MQNAFEQISRVWMDLPKEFENITLNNDIMKLKNIFEEKKIYFDDYLTKIIIIGDVSTGKSTIINHLVGKDYFETLSGNGTVAFFYCSQTDKDYEYFTINDDAEIKDIDILLNTQRLNVILPDFIDHFSIIKVYIKNDVNKLLEKQTVIVDCPGFGHNDVCDKEINKQCSSADIFIFVFYHNVPITPKQRNYIKGILEKFKNSTCLFVYNKCDEFEFEDEKLKCFKDNFFRTFNELCSADFKLDIDALYFISAKYVNMGIDYERLKTDILAHKGFNYRRYLNVHETLMHAIYTFKTSIRIYISNMRLEKIDLLKQKKEMEDKTNSLNTDYKSSLEFVNNLIEECSKNFQVEKLLNVIFMTLKNYNETCTKHEAYPFLLKLAEFIDNEICENLYNLLNDISVSKINNQIKDIKKKNIGTINIIENIQFEKENNVSFMITDMNLKIFWPHERGSKNKKVIEAYSKYLQGKEIQVKIFDNIKRFYNEQLSKIQTNLKKSITYSKDINDGNVRQLSEDLQNKESLIISLEKYEKDVLEIILNYNASMY